MAIDVFISYVNEDEAFARELQTALDGSCVNAWIDNKIPVAKKWDSFILNKIEDAQLVVALISVASLKKCQVMDNYIRKEWDHLSELITLKKKHPNTFLPILLNTRINFSHPRIKDNKNIPDILKSTQAFKFDRSNKIEDLVLEIKRLLKHPILSIESFTKYNCIIKAEIADKIKKISLSSFWIIDRLKVDEYKRWIFNPLGYKMKHKIKLQSQDYSIDLFLDVKYDMLRGSIRQLKIVDKHEKTLFERTLS